MTTSFRGDGSLWQLLWALAALLLLPSLGCGRGSAEEPHPMGPDAAVGSGSPSPPSRRSEGGPSPSEPARADAALGADTGSPLGPPAKEVVFRLVNTSRRPRYVVARGWAPSVDCSRRQGERWTECLFFPRSCSISCDSPRAASYGGVKCAPRGMRANRIEPGGAYDFPWSGELFEYDEVNPRCFRRAPAPEGRYRVKVCVSRALTCDGRPCPKSPPRAWRGGRPSGEPTCVEQEFAIPNEGVVEIPIR